MLSTGRGNLLLALIPAGRPIESGRNKISHLPVNLSGCSLGVQPFCNRYSGSEIVNVARRVGFQFFLLVRRKTEVKSRTKVPKQVGCLHIAEHYGFVS